MRFLQEFTNYLVFRTFFIFASTAFSILVVMLLLNIITIDEVTKILNLSPEAANALKTVFSRVQEVTGNLMDIISQLLNKLLGWADVDIDLNKIKIDTNSGATHGNIGSDALPQGDSPADTAGAASIPAEPKSDFVPVKSTNQM